MEAVSLSKPYLAIKYKEKIRPELQKEMKLNSVMAVPRLEKIVINIGVGEAINNKHVIKETIEELATITGQRPVITKAKKSNASFKIRAGMEIGVKVTLRGERMYTFLDKLINLALPRIRDFRGLKVKAFDGHGNYSLGVNEIIIFPEIELDKVKVMKGMDITIITSTEDDKMAFKLLDKFEMPFANRKQD